ncbi:MAG: EF-P lysine aminoacylase GenX [Proteobacteria bacterium]|nr:EF-P lysine aminoacylase GenX [Pseudomonadota bacterium]
MSENSENRKEVLTRRKDALQMRASVIRAIRDFFTNHDYLEVETPHRIPVPAPEAHIDATASGNWFLHTSPELCMKRMLAAGYHRIFQICRCFRHEERGCLHLPEFTLLEWYRKDIDYREMMEECEDMIISVARYLGRGEVITYQGRQIDLQRSWERISVREVFERYSSMSPEEALKDDLFDEIMVRDIEPHLGWGKPTFLYDYPVSLGAMAKTKKDDPTVAERFEIYIGSLELANAFSELTDVNEQRQRFAREQQCRRSLGKTVYPAPEKFLDALDYMPESAGAALGVDRLVMIFANTPAIDDVVAFTPEEL